MNHIYMKADKKVEIISTKEVLIGDIAHIEGKKEIVDEINKLRVLKVKGEEKKKLLIIYFTNY